MWKKEETPQKRNSFDQQTASKTNNPLHLKKRLSSIVFAQKKTYLSHFCPDLLKKRKDLCIRVCFSFFSSTKNSFFFLRKIGYRKQLSKWVEWYIMLKLFQSWFEIHKKKFKKNIYHCREKSVLKFCVGNKINNVNRVRERTKFFFLRLPNNLSNFDLRVHDT